VGIFSNKTQPIGVDVGSDSVKLSQLSLAGGGLVAVDFAQVAIPRSVRGDHSEREAFLVDALAEAVRNGRFRGRQVVTALGCSDLMVKSIRVPLMSQKELAETLPYEAADRFNMPAGQMHVEYLAGGEVREGDETREEIILLAADRTRIAQHVAVLTRAKLVPVAVDIEECAIFRSFERFLRRAADAEEVNCFVDLGASASKVVITRGREVVFLKRIEVAGHQFDQAVADRLSLSFEEACALRRKVARDSEYAQADRQQVSRAIYDSVRPELENLCREIALCLRYYSVTFRGSRPQQVTLVGGEANDVCIVQMLKQRLGLKTLVGEPFRGIRTDQISAGLDRRTSMSEWTVSIGLSLKGLDAEAAAQGMGTGEAAA
jgi:type IV pilus assembly protein PilM